MLNTPNCVNLINGVTHDLKSPLHAMLGFADLIKTELEQFGLSELTEKPLDHLHTVSKIGNDMLEIINNMLTAARIQAGQLGITPLIITPDVLVKRLQELEHTFRAEANSRNIRFSVDYGKLPDFAHWDVQALRYFVMNNLISNALKFIGKDGIVLVHIDTDDDNNVTITVADNGPGIAEHEKEIIFQQFTQGQSAKRASSGTGYGLYNASQMIKAHKGRIAVSEGIGGQGVCFSVIIPAQPFPLSYRLKKTNQVDKLEPALTI